MDLGLLLTIVGTGLAIIAFPATYYMGRRNRQKPDLQYVRDFDVLMSADDELGGGQLDLSIKGQNIDQISRTYVALYNKKGDSISGSEIVDSDPLRLESPEDDVILQARLLSQSRPQCGVALMLAGENQKAVRIGFDFLDAGDGLIIEVLHRGNSPIEVMGTIRGASFRDRGRATLTPHVIRTVAAKSLIARVKYRFSGRQKYVGISLLTVLILMIGMSIYSATISFGSATNPIAIADMDLSTLEGQRQFIAAANSAGIQSKKMDNLAIMLIGAPIVSVIFGFYALWYAFRVVIPQTITQNIVSEERKEHAD